MEPSLLTIPIELLALIFEACDDFSQVVALASVSKDTHAAWATNSAGIIWSVGRSQIRSFEDALMAVRATAIVSRAYLAGESPPPVTVQSLSGSSKLPNLAELKEVFNMQYLVRCIEWMYFNSEQDHANNSTMDSLFPDMVYGRFPAADRRLPGYQNEVNPEVTSATMESFRDSFYRAMYRILLAGALLARVYMAPMFQAKDDGKEAFLARVGEPGASYYRKHQDKIDSSGGEYHPTPEDFAYLQTFPVYNYDVTDWSEAGVWKYQEYESAFGSFASWIVENGREKQRNDPRFLGDSEPEWAEDPADVGAVRELMLLLVAFDHFNCKFCNDTWYEQMSQATGTKPRGGRTVTIVRFGHFQLEQASMPTDFSELKEGYIFTDYHPALEGSRGEDIPIQFDFWNLVNWHIKSRYVARWHAPGSPPMLELWHFALRRYLGLGFKTWMFWMPGEAQYEESTWWKEVGGGEIFINPNWAPVQKYEPGVISWEIR
ncbi:hypothetical protein VTL71DRAFT_12182 [Oculimacula yallundae]|uniref:F-box domain-containing protein n=1 Tax=Oculimacula yallundae TaxID=86028 RepID=A0ABR4CSI6_9HELO